MCGQRRRAVIEVGPSNAGLAVLRDGEEEFSYDIRARAYHPLAFAFPELKAADERRQMRVEVILRGVSR